MPIEAAPPPASISPRIRAGAFRKAALWLFVACGATAIIEPSPYEAMFAAALIVHARGGLAFDRTMAPMIVLLALFNAGGLIALPPFLNDQKAVMFAFISVYMAATAVFFAAVVAVDPIGRMRTIRSAYVAAALVAAACGILGYFNVAGLGAIFTIYDNARASGPFKDANVFGPFLAPAIVWLTQDLMLGRGSAPRIFLMLGVMLVGLLLSFSRGSWGVTAASLALMVGLTFLTTRSMKLRRRIAVMSVAGLAVGLVVVAAALSIPSVAEMMQTRASFDQYYDVGELGRFGAQVRSIPMLLERPFGFGPLQFRNAGPSGADPHEVYINAFASYGWLGGLAFVSFTATTLWVALAIMLRRSRVQSEAIALGASLIVQMAQGAQIDTDHWRHLYLMFGCLYGLVAAERRERAARLRLRAWTPDRRGSAEDWRLRKGSNLRPAA